jgi:hypothetical protein
MLPTLNRVNPRGSRGASVFMTRAQAEIEDLRFAQHGIGASGPGARQEPTALRPDLLGCG